MLLTLLAQPAIDQSIRFSAALYFKNTVKRHWKQIPGEDDWIAEQDREAVKSAIVEIMMHVPSTLQLQISEAVTIIANNDFPQRWPNLIPVNHQFHDRIWFPG